MKTALVIMAAGLGSRFGGGIKQLEPVGPNGEIIMDYSIHDAIEAGFNKIVFIIRKDIEADFREVIGERIEEICKAHQVEVAYGYQALSDLPGKSVPAERTKPWGTGQAVLAARQVVQEPFVVLNADDYYGKEAFVRLHDFLIRECADTHYAMAGFVLKNTLSDNGGVTRGLCSVNEEGNLINVVETKNIEKTTDGAKADGKALDTEALVSMNMWALSPKFITILENGFKEFLDNQATDLVTGEFLLPIYIGELLQKNEVSVKVLRTNDKWFGVTYKEDKPTVVESFRKLVNSGVYQEELFTDL